MIQTQSLIGQVIKTKWLKKYSDENYSTLEKCLDIELMLEEKITNLKVLDVRPNSTSYGRQCRYYYRLKMFFEKDQWSEICDVVFQDITLEQLRELTLLVQTENFFETI